MHTGSIVKQATSKARRAVAIALIGVSIVVATLFAENAIHEGALTAASERLIQAYRTADQVLLADERLTMSANMAAATGEERWIRRYEANLPLIDEAIAAAVTLASPDVASRFDAETRASNDRLVELERASFAAVRGGDIDGARRILDGKEYALHKGILSGGTSRFIEGMIASVTDAMAAVQARALVILVVTLIFSCIGAIALWRVLNGSLARSETAFLETEERIQNLAMNDMLTGLANRASLRHALPIAIDRADVRRSKLALLMIDLDRFKPINDRHGHLVGDLVLKEVAQRISRILDQGQLRARYGGDEFVAVIEFDTDDQVPRLIAKRLVESLSTPMTFDTLNVQIGASIGVAVYPSNADGEEDLIRKADLALYRAKLDGKGAVRMYDADLDVDADARTQLAEELRAGIQRGEVIPYFQPLVDLSTGLMQEVEILSRWLHPSRGQLPPAEFILLAESTGQISALTISVLRQACIAARGLPSDVSLSLNISPQQLEDEWLAPKILAVLTETGIPPQRLEIELTEHALVSDLGQAKRVITSLKNLGIHIALDDFGTGYSSLAYLSELPFDTLKIDRSFVRTLHDRTESAKVVSAIVGLGRSLGMSVVAEGVETERDAAALRDIGCLIGQGFLYSKPVPADGLEGLVVRMRQTQTKAVA